jgi:hypothetical protein
MKWLEF